MARGLKDRFVNVWDSSLEHVQTVDGYYYLPVQVGEEIWIVKRVKPEQFWLIDPELRFDTFIFHLEDIGNNSGGLVGLDERLNAIVKERTIPLFNVEEYINRSRLSCEVH